MGASYSSHGGSDGYYLCAARARGSDCDEPYTRVPVLDAQLAAATVRRLEQLRRELSQARPLGRRRTDEGRLDALRASLDGLRQRRARVLSLDVDGLITREETRKRLSAIDDEAAHLEREVAIEEAARRPITASQRAEVLAEVRELRGRWQALPVAGRRQIVALLAERIESRARR